MAPWTPVLADDVLVSFVAVCSSSFGERNTILFFKVLFFKQL